MKRKILSLALVLTMILSMLPMTLVTAVAEVTAPATLPNGSTYTTSALLANNASFTYGTDYNPYTKWLGVANTGALNKNGGIMFKVDTTAASGAFNLSFHLAAMTNSGIEAKIASNVGATRVFYGAGQAQYPADATSTWYISGDGATWTTVVNTSSSILASVTNAQEVIYVYIPYSEMYLTEGQSFMSGGNRNTAEPAMSFLDATELVGGWQSVAGSLMLCSDCAAAMGTVVSDFRFVTESAPEPEGPAPKAPTTLPNNAAYKTSSMFSDSNKVIAMNDKNSTAGKWLATTAAADIAYGFNNGVGVMFKVDASDVSAGDDWLNLCILTSITGNNGVSYTVVGHSGGVNGYYTNAQNPTTPSTWYVSTDGATWTELVDTNNAFRKPVTNHRGVTYVFIPFSEMYMTVGATKITTGTNVSTEPGMNFVDAKEAVGGWAAAANSIQFFQDGSNAMTAATISEVSFVFEKVDADVVVSAPTTLPDGEKFILESLFSNPGQQIALNGPQVNKWIGTTSADVIGNGFNNAVGIMFKVDASEVPAGSDMLSLMIMMSISGNTPPSGVDAGNMMLHSGGVNGYYSDAQKPAPSTWYVSTNGGDWTAITDSANTFRKPVTNTRGVTYVYVPFSEMYMRYGETYYKTGVNHADEAGMSFLDAKELFGGWKATGNMLQILPAGDAMTEAIFSEFSFVYSETPLIDTPADIFNRVSISVSDNIAYNLYAKIPADATDVVMTYRFNDTTYSIVGVEQEDGTVKYSLGNVLPQHMGRDIVATWTATIDGETVTDTYTSSVEDYLKAVLASLTYSDAHDAATALLHYGAAAQTFSGNTDALVNEGVAALPYPITRTELPYFCATDAEEIWTSIALRLENTIVLKIGLNAPAGITQVQYTIGSNTAVVDIVDGYVYIPVNAHQMMDVVTLECYDGSAATADGALEISASYYLNVVEPSNADMSALLDAIANYAAQATILAGGRPGSTEKAFSTVAQLALYDDFGGMSNVIQLTDGSFIIIDGGTFTKANEQALWAYLWEKSDYTKPVISAWIFTHLDLDHTGLGFAFLTNHKDDVVVETIGYTFPEDYQNLFAIKAGDDKQTQGYKNSAISLQTDRLAAFETIQKAYPNTEFWDMKKGDVKTFADVQAEILLSAKEVTHPNPFEHNSFSAVIQFVFTQNTAGTEDDTTYFVWGDADPTRLSAAASEYGAALKSDVMQAAHHALYGGVKSVYELVAPQITLMPIWEDELKYERKESETDEYGKFWTDDYNAYLLESSDCYFHDNTTVVNMADLTVSIR